MYFLGSRKQLGKVISHKWSSRSMSSEFIGKRNMLMNIYFYTAYIFYSPYGNFKSSRAALNWRQCSAYLIITMHRAEKNSLNKTEDFRSTLLFCNILILIAQLYMGLKDFSVLFFLFETKSYPAVVQKKVLDPGSNIFPRTWVEKI